MVVTVFLIVTLVFFATRLSGNPIDYVIGQGITEEDRQLLIRYYGLDGPLGVQYLHYLRAIADGQFGLSFLERRPVIEIVAERIGPSLQLLASGMALTLIVSVPLGILAAVHRDRWIGTAIMTVAFAGYAIPNFVLAILLILLFSFTLNWLPVVGNGSLWHFVMPTIALSGVLIASLTRFTRNAMLDVLGEDYMRTARAKGLSEPEVILGHGLRNASITILSVVGLQVAGLAAAGNVVVESVFAWPGVGDLLVSAALQRDYPVLQFAVLTVAVAVILVNALVDFAYTLVDPRIRVAA